MAGQVQSTVGFLIIYREHTSSPAASSSSKRHWFGLWELIPLHYPFVQLAIRLCWPWAGVIQQPRTRSWLFFGWGIIYLQSLGWWLSKSHEKSVPSGSERQNHTLQGFLCWLNDRSAHPKKANVPRLICSKFQTLKQTRETSFLRFHSNRPLERTPRPSGIPVSDSEILSYLYFGVPGVCFNFLRSLLLKHWEWEF